MNEPIWFNILVGFAYMLMFACVIGVVLGIVKLLDWAGDRFGDKGFVAALVGVSLLTVWVIGTIASYAY